MTTPPGHPYDNAAVADRLGGEVLEIHTDVGTFSGYRARPADVDHRGTVVLVHGWPQFASCWELVARDLLAQGFEVVAYDQRGYSPGVRPDDVAQYSVPHLVRDLDAVTRALGLVSFHLVGHDWGGVMGWAFAEEHADRLLTFTSVSSAHTVAHALAVKNDADQAQRMQYARDIRKDHVGMREKLLADGGRNLAGIYGGAVPEPIVQSYLDRFSDTALMDASLKYYCALGMGDMLSGNALTVPTLYLWGNQDVAFARTAAEGTERFVECDYRFVELDGASHWLPEEEPARVAAEVAAWAGDHA